MRLFVEAIAVGIIGAVTFGFAYWGILVLLQPGLDRLRVLVHGKPAMVPSARMPVLDQCAPSPLQQPGPAIPLEPRYSAWIDDAFPNAIRNLVYVKTSMPNAAGIVHFVGHGSNPIPLGATPSKQMVMQTLVSQGLKQALYVGVEHAEHMMGPKSSGFCLPTNRGNWSEGTAKMGHVACVSGKMRPLQKQLPDLWGMPPSQDDTHMSKLRLANFSPTSASS